MKLAVHRHSIVVVAAVVALLTSSLLLPSSALDAAATSPVVSTDPARLLESRTGPNNTTIDGLFEGTGRVPAGSVIELQVTGRAGVPADAQAVMLNLTAIQPSAPGHITAYPCGTTRPKTSNVNYLPGQFVANLALTKIGTSGTVCIYTLAEIDIIADLNGYVPATASGTITIVKDAAPNDPQDVSFVTDVPGHAAFDLDDDADATLPNTRVMTGVAAGTYAVTETVPAGWDLTSATCSDGSPVSAIEVSPGEAITCTFTNSKLGTITIVKDAVPDAPDDFSFTGDLGPFVLDDDADATLSNTATFTDLVPMTYVVTESDPTPAVLSSIVCDDGASATPSTSSVAMRAATINVDPGEDVTCTFLNGVNAAPIITSNGGGAAASTTVPENQTAVTDVQATDDADAEGAGLVYSLTGGLDQGLFSIVPATGVLTFDVAPDFEDPGDAGGDNVYDVQVTVTDSGTLTDVQDIAVTVSDANDAPVVTTSGGTAGFTEDAGPVTVDAALTVTDPDDTTLDRATVTITNLLDAGDEVLAAAASGGIVAGDISYAAPTLTIDPAADQPLADFQAVLQSVTYENSSDDPDTTDRVVRFVANDGDLDSNNGDKTVGITALNDPPTLTPPGPFDSLGNVGISVPAGSGLLAAATIADLDFAGPFTIATPFPTTTTASGALSISADGSFTYTPTPGFEGADTFDYQICDNGTPTPAECSTAMTVTIDVSDVIWFVDNSQAAGDGTLASPFNTLAQFNASALDETDDVIFIEETGSGDYTGGITPLLVGQQVIGNGATVSLAAAAGLTVPTHSVALPATNGARPTVTEVTPSNALTISTDNTIRGLDIDNSGGGTGLIGSVGGTLAVSELAITSNGGPALDLDGGIQNLSIGGVTVTNSSSGGIDLTNIGATSTIDLSGLGITTTGGTGINVSGGGTINVTGTNSVTTVNGPAIDIDATTIGGLGMTFQSVSASNAANGIELTNTGAGTFTVTGTGTTSGSGGTITSITGDAVRLGNTGGAITLQNVDITDIGTTAGGFNTRSGHDAIHGQLVSGGLVLDNVVIDNVSDNAINGAQLGDGLAFTDFVGLTITNSTITDTNRFHVAGVADSQDEGAVRIRGLSGTVAITNSTFARGGELLDLFTDDSGSLTLTVTGNSFTDAYQEFTSGGTASIGKMCLDVTTRGSLTSTITVGGVGVLANTFTNCGTASLRIASDSAAVTGDISATITNNVFRVTDHSSTLGTSGNFPQGGVLVRGTGTGNVDALVTNNDFGTWTGAETADWVMNADGAVGALSIIAEGGAAQVEASGNEFNSPINAPWFVRADGPGTDAEIFFHDNTYRSRTGFFSPDPFFGTFTAPGIAHTATGQSSAALDFVMSNEAVSVHDESFDFQDTIQVRAQTSATVCASFTNVTTALAGANGDIHTNNSTGTFNRFDGGGNDPFQTTGAITALVSDTCSRPTGGPF